MLVKGLKKINQRIEDDEKNFSGGDKVTWFKVADKQAVTVQFLQELDDSSPNYSEKNGLGFLAVEHVNPKNWRNRAQCTVDEGPCYGCEMHQKDPKAGWKQKTRLYVNALVDDGVNEPFVAVLAQGNGPKSVTQTLIEIAGDLDTITDTLFKIKRNGSGPRDTAYVLTQRGKTDNDVEQYELFDLEKVARFVEYDEQEEYYNRTFGKDEEEKSDRKTDSDDW